jgi:hemoglobin/transferrin/lactoferrin receptor protein
MLQIARATVSSSTSPGTNGHHIPSFSRLAARLLATTAIAGLCSLAVVPVENAVAQTTSRLAATRSFDIPAQPLGGALASFGRQSGLRVRTVGPLPGATSSAVSGSYTPRQALAQLLAGTGVSYQVAPDGTAVIGSARPSGQGGGLGDGSTLLETISVLGSGGGLGSAGEVIITSEDLERRNPSNLADVFRGEPGIEVGSSISASQKVYVHGIEETNLAVTIDGSRLNNKVFHHSTTNLIDPALLKAVQVDAGVAPADAGPGALAGAIRYETKDARDLLSGDGVGGFVKSSYNTNGKTFTTSVSAYGLSEGLEFIGYLNFGRGSNFKAGNGETVGGTGTDLLSGIGKFAYEFESGDRFSISHERVRDDAARPFRANIGFIEGRPDWEPRVRDYSLERQNTVFTYTDSSPEGWWDPTILLAYSRADVGTTTYLRPRPPATDPSTYPIEGTTESFNGKVENRFALDMGSITAGFDFYNDTATLDDPYDRSKERARNVGLYAQARLEPWERTRLSFGGRADRQWFTGTEGSKWTNSGLSGNISGEYDLVPEFLTAKAGYSRVWAGIPLAENFIMNPAWDYGSGPKPVTGDNYTVGLVANYNGFSLEGGVFLTDLKDARTAKYAANRATEAHDARSKGFEIGAGYDWGSGYFKAKYANIRVTIDGEPADSDIGQYLATPAGEFITLAAAHTFTEWGVTVGGDVEIALDYKRVKSGYPPLKGYEVVNLFAEYQPPSRPSLTLRAEVQNLFDATYASRATYGQEFGTVTPLYEPGRSFILSAKATF